MTTVGGVPSGLIPCSVCAAGKSHINGSLLQLARHLIWSTRELNKKVGSIIKLWSRMPIIVILNRTRLKWLRVTTLIPKEK